MFTLDLTGTFENLKVVNSPQRAMSVNGGDGSFTMTSITVDNCEFFAVYCLIQNT